MKHTALVLALGIAVTSLISGQAQEKTPAAPAATKPAAANVEQTLTKIEHDALAAFLKRDVAAFGKYFADDASITTPDGSLQTKAQLLADVKSGDLVLQSSQIADMKVRVYGDAAVVTYTTTDKGKYKGQEINGQYRWTDVFVRRAGAWQIVAGHGTPIPKPAK
jgi:ketosteroid isomerase-like protein